MAQAAAEMALCQQRSTNIYLSDRLGVVVGADDLALYLDAHLIVLVTGLTASVLGVLHGAHTSVETSRHDNFRHEPGVAS